MQLIRALLVAATAVVLLSGISIFFGSRKQEKKNSIFFLIATLGVALWAIATIFALNMPSASGNFVHVIVTCIIGGITLCDIGFLTFLGWKYKGGKFLAFILAAIGAFLVALLARDSSTFYNSFDLSQNYLKISVEQNWYFFSLIAYFSIISLVFFGFLARRIKKATSPSLKIGLKVFYICLAFGNLSTLAFNITLVTSLPNLIWISPMIIVISIMSFYYSIIKSHTLNIHTKWLEITSYAILLATAAIIYLLAFYIVFTTLFKVPNPSHEILILHGIMAAFLIFLTPILFELTNFMKASFFSSEIELSYIMKKLDSIKPKTFDPKDTICFLADTLHYENCALIISGHAHTNNGARFSSDETEYILRLKPSKDQLWIDQANLPEKNGFNISEIVTLRNKEGHELGKLVLGKRFSEKPLIKEDFAKIEAVASVLSALIK